MKASKHMSMAGIWVFAALLALRCAAQTTNYWEGGSNFNDWFWGPNWSPGVPNSTNADGIVFVNGPSSGGGDETPVIDQFTGNLITADTITFGGGGEFLDVQISVIFNATIVLEGGSMGGSDTIFIPELLRSATNVNIIGPSVQILGGTLELDSGSELLLEGGCGGSNATFNVESGEAFDLTGGNYVGWSGTMNGSGGGQVQLNSGLINAGTGLRLNFPPGLFQWSGGQFSGAATNINAVTLLATNYAQVANTTFYNAGVFQQTNAGTLNNDGHGNGTFANQATGTFQFAGDGGDVDVHFNNSGFVQKSSGTGISSFSQDFNNLGGSIEVDSGTLVMAGGGTSSNATFTVETGAVCDLTGGSSPNWSGVMTGSGAGQVQFNNGSIYPGNLPITLNFQAGLFQWTGGQLRGVATNVNAVTLVATNYPQLVNTTFYNAGVFLQTNGGTLNNDGHGNGTFVNLSPGTYQFAGDGGDVDVNFNNAGLVRKSSGTGLSSFSHAFNSQGGMVEVDGGELLMSGGGSSSNGTFNIAAGAMCDVTGGNFSVWSGAMSGSGAGQVQLNSGVINSGPGLTLNFPPGLFLWTGGQLSGLVTNVNAVTLVATNYAQIPNGTFYNAGVFQQINGGTLNNDGHGNGTFVNLPQGTCQFAGDGGDVDVNFNNAGLLQKSSGIGVSSLSEAFNNLGGSIEVDSGTLSLGGRNYSQGGGALTVKLGGLGAGQSGQLACGSASLGGPLNVSLANGFVPAIGNQFQVLASSGLSGTFTSVNVPAGLSVLYTNSSVWLVVTSQVVAPVQVLAPQLAGTNFTFSFSTVSNQSYSIQQNTDLTTTNWTFFTNFIGQGLSFQFITPATSAVSRFFRVSEP